MIVVGITGGLSTGKSTVAGLFRGLGAGALDADQISHELAKPETAIYRKVVSCFGKQILNKDKTIDRKKLAAAVFGKQKNLLKLCGIIHPAVIKKIENSIKEERKKRRFKILVVDAPLLFEAGTERLFDIIVVVTASRKTQLLRSREKLGLSKSQIESRMRAQIPMLVKEALADFVIDNNGSINNTKRETEMIWKKLVGKEKVARCYRSHVWK